MKIKQVAIFLILVSVISQVSLAHEEQINQISNQTYPNQIIQQNSKIQPEIGLYILNLKGLDILRGTYQADVYLSLYCNSCNLSTLDIEFHGARIISKDTLINKDNDKFYRYNLEFLQPLDLSKYPLDSHTLRIDIEDKRILRDTLTWKNDIEASGISNGIKIPGIKINGWKSEIVDYYYKAYDEWYSRYRFDIYIERDLNSTAVKFLAPITVMIVILLIATFLELKYKIITTLSVLLAAVFLHINFSYTLPQIGYLTTLDKIFLALYVTIAWALMLSVLTAKGYKKYIKNLSPHLITIVFAVLMMIAVIS